MLNVQCRLCSAETGLISLFNGKCRGNRDNIRKLIHITTGIKFQKNDACKCICFPCTVQIYNFYIFRSRSIENEERLQALVVESEKERPNKICVPDLDDIKLPNIEELKQTLTPWLISKWEYCATNSTDNDENMKDTNTNTVTYKENTSRNDDEPEVVENSTQCDSVENFDQETQSQMSINEAFTQTSEILSRNVHTQCDFNIRQQKILKEVHTQCDFKIWQQKILKVVKESSIQTEEVVAINANRSVYIQCELLKGNEETPKRRSSQRESNRVVRSRHEMLKNGQKLSKKASRDSVTQTETRCDAFREDQLFESHNRCEKCCDRDSKGNVKLGLLSIKQEIESPQSLSPIKCLNISEDGTKTEALASPDNSNTSPSSSSLLTVQNKIQNVIICEQCDKTTYSKKEYMLHRRSHMICNFCKKRFASVRKTKIHLENNCEVQKLIKTEPVVPLIRLEYLKDVQKKYPSCLKILSSERHLVKDIRKTVRIRSRSISNVDDIDSNYCNTCKSYISILNGISVGVDKSVQTNFLCDKELIKSPLEYFCENLMLKRNRVDNNFAPIKKFKLSK